MASDGPLLIRHLRAHQRSSQVKACLDVIGGLSRPILDLDNLESLANGYSNFVLTHQSLKFKPLIRITRGLSLSTYLTASDEKSLEVMATPPDARTPVRAQDVIDRDRDGDNTWDNMRDRNQLII